MKIEEIRLITPDLILASPEEVSAAERELGCRFPAGYAEYVQRLGEGTLNDLLYVWPPRHVVEQLTSVKELWTGFDDFWPWNETDSEVDEDRVRESIALGDTNVGDLYLFHPDDPDTVLIAPRNLETTYAVGPGLDGAVEWTFNSGNLCRREPIAEFYAHVPTRHIRFRATGSSMRSVRDHVASIAGATDVHQAFPDVASVYFPALKGLVALHEYEDGSVQVELQCQFDAPEADVEDLQIALSRAGFRYQAEW